MSALEAPRPTATATGLCGHREPVAGRAGDVDGHLGTRRVFAGVEIYASVAFIVLGIALIAAAERLKSTRS